MGNSYDGMFFGYKPPIEMEVKYPVERFHIKGKEDETSLYIILDSKGTTVVDIKGDFYSIKQMEGMRKKYER